MTECNETDQEKWGKLVARSWTDPDLRKALLDDPTGTLRTHGLYVPKGLNVKIVENTEAVFHLILPPKPSDDLTEEELKAVAGGASTLVHC